MTRPDTIHRVELLAPAGTLDAFHAAIDAGADAVYCGLDRFNARLRARNLTAKTLSYLVPYAHSRDVKVYITLNTLIKQQELEAAVHTLFQLEQIGVDGIIVQDLGLAALARARFPRLALHASTQMGIHNSDGVALAARMGVRRVILARELTLDEIRLIRGSSTIELEVFVHGALCYSLSGSCLASSFLGGQSGNRGRCTQVCRRKFRCGDSEGHYFSPRDFSAMMFVPRLIDAGVCSLKIEGRMRSLAYLRTVVAAYRQAIDMPASIPQLVQDLNADFGRAKTTLFLGGLDSSATVCDPADPGTGILLGPVEDVQEREIVVRTSRVLSAGDNVRIQPLDGFEGEALKVVSCRVEGAMLRIAFGAPVSARRGDVVYFIGTGRATATTVDTSKVQPVRLKEFHPDARGVVASVCPKPSRAPGIPREPSLILRIDSPAWLPIVKDVACDGLIVSFERPDMQAFIRSHNRARPGPATILAFPPFVAEGQRAMWHTLRQLATETGLHWWMAPSVNTPPSPSTDARTTADSTLWCLNRAAQKALTGLGLRGFTYSMEDDFPNMRAAASPGGMAVLFAHVPLFVSRMQPLVSPGSQLTDARGDGFFTATHHGLHYLIGSQPLCLLQKREKLLQCGLNRFVIDLSFVEPRAESLRNILDCYNRGVKVEGSTMLNFKRELG